MKLPSHMKKNITKLEIEVIHKRTGYIVPGNYKKEPKKVSSAEEISPKCKITYFDSNLEFFRIDVLNANLLNGRLIIGGLALPKVDVENLNLTIKDAEGIKEAQWGLPSPVFGEQRKDNPKAKNARFRVDNVVVGDTPIEIFVNGKKVAEIRIGGVSQVK